MRKPQRPDPPPRMPGCPTCGKPWRCPDHQTALDYITPDQTTIIRPGQTLILRYSRMITAQQAEEVKRLITAKTPGIEVLIIAGADQLMVYDSKRE